VPIVAIPRASLGVIEKAFGVKMDTLMRMQSSFDITLTRKRENEIRVRRISLPAA
jgi:plasmid maintenance system antidote protein VapI